MSAIRAVPTIDTVPSSPPKVGELRSIATEIRAQCRGGWDINALTRIHAELARLADASQRDGDGEVAEQLLALETSLRPALARRGIPDTGATALIAALTEHLVELLPALATAAMPAKAVETATIRRVLVSCHARKRASALASALTSDGNFEVRVVDEPLAALDALRAFHPDCILAEQHSAACDGVELAALVHQHDGDANVPVLLLDDKPATGDRLAIDAANAVIERVRAAIESRRDDDTVPASRPSVTPARRAWLVDRLEAALAAGNADGGLLDVAIDEAAGLRRRLGMDGLAAIHADLGGILARLLDGDDILAPNGAGYLVLSRGRSSALMQALAEEIRDAVLGERFGPAAVPVTVSIGGRMLDASVDDVSAVLGSARHARETAPASRIGWYVVRQRSLDADTVRHALAEGRVHLVFQSIIAIAGAPTTQYQALARLRGANGTVHSAGEFLPIARRTGLLPDLDRLALDQGLAVLAQFQRRTRPMRLFVTQSNASLGQRDYPAQLATKLAAHGVHGARLVINVHLDDCSDAHCNVLPMAPRLRALGVGLCLSDVDRSALATQLMDILPLDFARLAPAAVAHPGALVPTAHARGIALIAPQIEDGSRVEALHAAGIDFVQGNSLAHPARALRDL